MPQIIGINEVLPKNFARPIFSQEFAIPNYEMIAHPNVEKNCGRGTIMYIHKDINYKQVEFNINDEQFQEAIFAEIKLKGNDKLLCACMYRRGESSEDNNELLFKTMRKMADMKYSHLLLMGDFNFKEIDWKDSFYTGNNTDHAAFKFIECVRDCFLFQHVTEHTRQRGNDNPSTLDLIFSNEENMVSNLDILAPLGKSDHAIIKFTINCEMNYQQPQIKKLFNKGNYDGIKNKINSINWEEEFNKYPDDINKQWKFFCDIYADAEKTYIPRKTVYVNGKMNKKLSTPLDKKTLRKIKQKNKLWSKFRNDLALEEEKLKFRQLRNQVRRLTRKGKKIMEKNIAKNIKSNPKAFWKYTQSKLKTKPGIPDLEKAETGDKPTFTKTDDEKADVFLNYFGSVFTLEPDSEMPHFEERNYKGILENIDLTEDMVLKKLKKLKVNKSPGPDAIHPRVIQEIAESITVPITLIFKTSLQLKELPDQWKHASVCAIFKKGNKTKPQNYRPVSLTSIICKTLESLVRDHIIEHMKLNNLFSEKQFGFISGRSTTLQLLHVLNIWTDILDQGGEIEAIYCDFMKAFDKVPHKRLIHKINKYGIKGNVLGWIKAFLSNRTQCVNIGCATSNTAPVTSGIPQGSVLGPILFVIYINDLPDIVDKDSHVFLFADDTKLFREINSPIDRKILQQDLDNLTDWSNKWLLKFHPDKCVSMIISRNSEIREASYVMENHNLNCSNCEKDIGVFIDNTLSFERHISYAVNKANRVLAITRKTFECMDNNIFNQIFKTLVRPHLEYAAPVWSPHLTTQKELLENVQRRATKMVPGLSDLSYPERLRKLNLPTLAYRRVRGDMIQAYKLMNDIDGYDKSLPSLLQMSNTGLRGHSKKLYKQRANKNIRKYYFTNRITSLWNSLPEHIIKSKDLINFEKNIDEHWKNQDLVYDNFKADIQIGPERPDRPGTTTTNTNSACDTLPS